MMKFIFLFPGISLFIFGGHLLFSSHEYEVNFEAKTLPGDIIQTIRIWDRALENAEVVQVDSVFRLDQILIWNNRKYIYTWNFSLINDSTTEVNIKITQPERRFANKLLVPFTQQPIEQDATEIAYEFYNILKEHLKISKVKIIGESETKSKFCACRELETDQIEKANGMMKEYGTLVSFVADFNLKPDGPPIVKVKNWDHNKGKLQFDFCFPINKINMLPDNQAVIFKEFRKEKALKATYNGNYITSDRAWYELINYAQAHGYEVTGKPVEYFYDNPNLGMNETEWMAEIYLPVK